MSHENFLFNFIFARLKIPQLESFRVLICTDLVNVVEYNNNNNNKKDERKRAKKGGEEKS